MAASLPCAASSLSFMRLMRPKISDRSMGLDRDAGGLKNALGVAHRVESGGTRADGADLEILEALHDAADGGEPLQVGLELRRLHRLSVQRGERVLDAVLHHVVAAAHLPAEAVAAHGDGHVVGAVGRGLHQHRHLEAREADRVHDAALFAEVGQSDDDAVDLVGVFLEQLGAALRLSIGFHGAVLRLFAARARWLSRRRPPVLEEFLRGRSWPGDQGKIRGCPPRSRMSFAVALPLSCSFSALPFVYGCLVLFELQSSQGLMSLS